MNILDDLNRIINTSEITKSMLLNLLKNYAKDISVYDLMKIYTEVLDDMKYVQKNYHPEAIKTYIDGFINRINEIKKDNNNYKELIDNNYLKRAYILFKSMYNKKDIKIKDLIYILTSLYATYILEEPIHPTGTVFPGSLKIIKKDEKYYCPVKKANLNTPHAVCRICIAKQLNY